MCSGPLLAIYFAYLLNFGMGWAETIGLGLILTDGPRLSWEAFHTRPQRYNNIPRSPCLFNKQFLCRRSGPLILNIVIHCQAIATQGYSHCQTLCDIVFKTLGCTIKRKKEKKLKKHVASAGMPQGIKHPIRSYETRKVSLKEQLLTSSSDSWWKKIFCHIASLRFDPNCT